MGNVGSAEEGRLNLLRINTTCVLATLLPGGSPYTSAAHFATDEDSEDFYISLHDESRTAKNLILDPRAAVTVGDDPEIPATLQMRGEATVSSGPALIKAQDFFYARFPHSARYRDDPHTLLVCFRPTWSRYSDAELKKEFFVRGFAAESLK
ncbi:pyridoxamine 5'-phosphate oxidase family protein [Nocardia sp. 2YAB30]|uniref:pyridoxamine 5'-phosphate oxidase family protein n=1 Tax=unclassified Nocardia TaxID=2637762 RepID=UPI003F992D50